jgi:NitT/TauT family transport system substrate-binding protein
MKQSRRCFLASVSLAGAAGLVGAPTALRAEPPPETTTVRMPRFFPASCEAPEYVAEELLRAEGFTNVSYVDLPAGVDPALWMADGKLDFDFNYAATNIAQVEAGVPIVVLAGLHSGCLELITNESIHSITDLRGKRVGMFAQNSSPHVLIKLMAAYVGLDPVNDIQWIEDPKVAPIDLFIDGKIDAFLGTPPEPQVLRARKIGHTILNTTIDRPWSDYYCCMIASTADYVGRYPTATKRVMRALFKAMDVCVSETELAAQQLSSGRLRSQSDYALEILTEVRYDRWREFDPEDTLRFYALRMHEAGMIKSDPNTIIANGTDWRFLDELKRELKT